MSHNSELCLRYLDEDLSPQEAQAFSRLVATSPDVAGQLARYLIDEHYFSHLHALPTSHGKRSNRPDDSAIHHAIRHLPQADDIDAVLKYLLLTEQQAEAGIVCVEDQPPADPGEASDPLPAIGALAAFDGRQAPVLGSGRALKPRLLHRLSVAAVLLLGLGLLFVFMGQDRTESGSQDAGPGVVVAPAPQQAGTSPVVARLTADADARWHAASGAVLPKTGDPLHAGQKLVLTEGHIELTTNRGAIAAIEAPCTFELTTAENALILHSGKLVGICQSASSKGFVVKTRYGEIKDIGTEFGVHVQQGKVTATVFHGEIEVTAEGGETQSVRANQTARLDVGVDARAFSVESQLDAGFGSLYTRPAMPQSRWQRHLARLDATQGLIGQLSFDDNGPLLMRGKGTATFHATAVEGTIQPGNPSTGRAASLRIDNERQGVTLRLDPALACSQVTLVAWARINRAPDQGIATLLYPSERPETGNALAWHYTYGGPSMMALPAWGFSYDISKSAYSSRLGNSAQGRWHCYAVTIDTQEQTTRYYIDGEHAGTSHWFAPGDISLSTMRIGNIDQSTSRAKDPRYINGSLGLFLAMDRAMPPDQIQSLYEASKGQFAQPF